jgi:O-antigen/teichoic acid export membrane protein
LNPDVAPDADAPSATLLAVRNALKLGASLVGTWGIALAIRLLLPRYLGPIRFGTINFADGFTAAFFILTNLGADAYVRKEVAVRPAHASEFFGGIFVLRVGMSALILAAMALVLRLTGRHEDVQIVVLLYGITQFFVAANTTLSAMLHAKGRVGAMSVLAVVTKVIWAVGILAAMATDAGLWAYAASYLASESVETVVLYKLAHGHLDLRFRVDARATKAMLVAGLPYYVLAFALTTYGKVDVSLLEFLGDTEEVGWYGAANAVAGLTLLVTPLIGWVLTPMFARAAARSKGELEEQVRRSLELIMTVAIPASLVVTLGADLWIRVIFGKAFAPATNALRLQAVIFVLTYVAMIYGNALVMLERPWVLTNISLASFVLDVLLNVALIQPSMHRFGPGGGATGCALAMLATETFVILCMTAFLGRSAFDRRSASTIGKSIAAYVLVCALHVWMRRLGYVRIAVDAAVYLLVVLATGALRPKDMIAVVGEAVRRRGA